MKNMIYGFLCLFVAFATSVVQGGQPAPGVAGVDVFVKQMPAKRSLTDAHGNFALDGLAPGSYTIAFRAKKAKDTKTSTTKVIVATSYSIKIEGTKRPVNQTLTSDKLLAGVDVPVEVGAGAKVRGQVAAGGLKKMVWIPREPGSNIPGHWAEPDSAEAKAKRSDTQILSREELSDAMNKGNSNMVDPKDPRNAPDANLAPR